MSADPTRDAMRRLQAIYQPAQTHASDIVTCRRKITDSPVAGSQDYGTRDNTMANRRNGGSSTRRRVNVHERIGAAIITAPTTRVSAPRVTRGKDGTRVDAVSNAERNAGIKARTENGTEPLPDQGLRSRGEYAQWRQWAALRRSYLETLGEQAHRGSAYPSGFHVRTVQGQRRVTLAVSPAGKETTLDMAGYADEFDYHAWVRAGRPVSEHIAGVIFESE